MKKREKRKGPVCHGTVKTGPKTHPDLYKDGKYMGLSPSKGSSRKEHRNLLRTAMRRDGQERVGRRMSYIWYTDRGNKVITKYLASLAKAKRSV